MPETAAIHSLENFRLFSNNRLFEGIAGDVLVDLRDELQFSEMEAGEIVFREAEPGDSLYLIGRGSVRIYKESLGGQQETLSVIQAGNFFGEMSLLDGQPRSATAVTSEWTLLARVDSSTFQHILELAPNRLHLNFLRSVSERLRSVNTQLMAEVMRAESLAARIGSR